MSRYLKLLILALLSAIVGAVGGRSIHSSAPVSVPPVAPSVPSASAPASVLEAKADALVASADALAKLVDAGLTPASAPASQP